MLMTSQMTGVESEAIINFTDQNMGLTYEYLLRDLDIHDRPNEMTQLMAQ